MNKGKTLKHNLYVELFWEFFKLGLFTIGGGMAMVPLIQNIVVEKKGWLSEEEAVEMLSALAGRSHEVYTGVCFLYRQNGEEKRKVFHEETKVTFYPMTKQETEAYVSTKDCMDKAGSYGIQGPAAAFIKGICGDYNNVVGLPAARVYQELKECEWL